MYRYVLNVSHQSIKNKCTEYVIRWALISKLPVEDIDFAVHLLFMYISSISAYQMENKVT